MSKPVLLFWGLCLTAFTAAVMADDQLAAKAAQLHQAGQWAESIEVHQQWLKAEPDLPVNQAEIAWYRLAHAHLQTGQGEAALAANAQLAKATVVHPSLVLYQKAQALKLLNDEERLWPTLEQMIAAGYSNVEELQTNPMWQDLASEANFQAVIEQADQNLRPCMHQAIYRQFDFWLGQWEVYGNLDKSGPLYGHNAITLSEQGCLIMEHWQGASGSSGTSMNYYDGIQGQWVQRWVSSGVVIDYAGGMVAAEGGRQAMQLVGKIHYASTQQQPQLRDFRGTWTPLDGGVVQQFFEESIDGGATWYPWFNGYYFPKATSEEENHE
ncbi:hypothetical protein [Marinicella meishanensis]|uniref:hypothetical protein n=1 Tax=Marinicella meishanensis TaxID=2873263 RepID=UPI001CC0327A|nr:hypothetical protein [Marinicella sp. NBU2979]